MRAEYKFEKKMGRYWNQHVLIAIYDALLHISAHYHTRRVRVQLNQAPS
jgi:hypothetical protein